MHLPTQLRPSSTLLAIATLTSTLLSAAASSQPQQQQHAFLSDTDPNKPLSQQPALGFGTWNLNLSPDNTTEAVAHAIEVGYRQIDCAAAYANEKDVGRGIAVGLERAKVAREEVWVTSKLWNDHHEDPARVEAGLTKTLEDLGLEYLDLYLMHWPVGSEPSTQKPHLDYLETWRSLIALPKSKVHNIGVSNFSPAQLETIIRETGVKPSVHQMELHPYLPQSAWLASHKALGISVTAYSPLGNSNPTYDDEHNPPALLKNKAVVSIADDLGCTAAQVVLAWGLNRGTSLIPKSSHPAYIEENFASRKCQLRRQDLVRIRLMGRKYLKRFNDPSESWGVRLFEGLDDA